MTAFPRFRPTGIRGSALPPFPADFSRIDRRLALVGGEDMMIRQHGNCRTHLHLVPARLHRLPHDLLERAFERLLAFEKAVGREVLAWRGNVGQWRLLVREIPS